MRRAVNPLREPMKRFATGSVPFVTQEAAPFFRDVADHVIRVSETIETLDTLLSTAFDAHLARISVQQNEDMRKISAWVAIAAVGTLVAGVYGMNFAHMPELRWHYGYFYALGLMVVASAGALPVLQEVRLAVRPAAQVAVSQPALSATSSSSAEPDPVGHELGDRVPGHEPQQPGDRGVGDHEADQRADDGLADADVAARARP